MITEGVRTVEVIRYVKPLREGGSLPAIVHADDDFPYVLKFRGAGQGSKALTAELVGGLLAQKMGLKVPELVFMELDDRFSKTEPDEEIQDLLRFSVGLNLGLHFLSGAHMYDPQVPIGDETTVSKIVLLDSILSNIDRTAKNANLLNWKGQLWLIDHGAGLYFHHNWDTWSRHLERTFPEVKHHILLDRATGLTEAAEQISQDVSAQDLVGIVSKIPDQWLVDESTTLTAQDMRSAYVSFLQSRLDNLDGLVKEAEDAR
ncbi:MAG: aminotransferase class I and II [Saprospiraceae bacterium]|nr:aminotransferase class I and II [Saprospiraceae bacterium]